MSAQRIARDDLPPMLSLRQYADYTRMSYDTVKQMAREGKLPAPIERLGRRYYIPRDALLNQMDGTTEIARLTKAVDALTARLDRFFGALAAQASPGQAREGGAAMTEGRR